MKQEKVSKRLHFFCANDCTLYAIFLRTHIIKHMIIGVCLPSLGINESPININGYQSLPLQMLCFPWVVDWVRSQGWQPDNSSKD